jgi:alkaline phosphatase D
MRYLLLFAIFSLGLSAQDSKVNYNGKILGPPEGSPAKGYGRVLDTEELIYLEQLRPFYHGVASGDPQQNSVIIWTRVTTEVDGPVQVAYEMATDKEMTNIISSGNLTAHPDMDYCVKEDVMGLDPGTTYYYQFSYDGDKSIIGRTRTLPADGSKDHLRLAVISCVNYQWGFFNALERIAERDDLDAVIHMGDYIYEYSSEDYTHPDFGKFFPHNPDKEIVSMADYRLRYSQYRLDPMMIRMHQQHPMIAVWDDHESTNDSYRDGAENHQDGEGEWSDRVDIATSVYAEWMPIRIPDMNDKRKIYRSFKFGDMLDLYMMELRLTGKDQPAGSKASGQAITDIDPIELQTILSADVNMIDGEQFQWLTTGIISSSANWKIMGSSVMMVPFPGFFNPDAWDGYYTQREILFGTLLQAGTSNVGTISGDFHMSFATNLVSSAYNDPANSQIVGFEFTTPSVTSANINEQSLPLVPIVDPATGDTTFVAPIDIRLPERSPLAQVLESDVVNGTPWFHYANSDQHGYMVLDVQEDRIQTDWFFVPILEKSNIETSGASAVVNSGNPLVSVNTNGAATGKTNAPELAPFPSVLSVEDDGVLPMGVFPNPANHTTQVSFAINKPQNINLSLYDFNGVEIAKIGNKFFNKGVQAIEMNITNYPTGNYFIKIETSNSTETIPLKIVR